MDDVSTRASARVLADRYALLERIGSGGAGVVWRAHDQLLERTVAVKLLHHDLASDPGTTERFRAEAAAAAKLTHPHAVIVYDIGETDDGDYLVMELVEGATLGDLLDEGPLLPGVVAALGNQIGRALGAAHARGLVHRDVKPANILITTEGVAKVADFGIARALGDATSRLTATGHVMGTARYLAPEQLRDEGIDARADVYALGLLLHQAVTGQLPFGDGTAVEVASRRLVGDLPAPSDLRPDIPPALDEAICRAIQLDPEGRYTDGAEFAAALAASAAPYAGKDLASKARRHARVAASFGTVETTPAVGAAEQVEPHTDPAAARATIEQQPVARQDAAHRTAALPTGHGPDDRGADAPGDGAAPPRTSERRRGGPWGIVVALAAIAVVALLVLGREGDGGGSDGAGDDTGDEPTTVEVVAGSDHDPFGSGEHGDRAPEAFDGNPETYWRTQQYRGNPELGGLKPGVGLWLDLGDPHEITDLVVTTTNPGATFTVFVGEAPPSGSEAPEDWGSAVAEVAEAGEEERITLEDATEGQVWMLWFTSLPPDGGRFRATVSEVRFEAK